MKQNQTPFTGVKFYFQSYHNMAGESEQGRVSRMMAEVGYAAGRENNEGCGRRYTMDSVTPRERSPLSKKKCDK